MPSKRQHATYDPYQSKHAFKAGAPNTGICVKCGLHITHPVHPKSAQGITLNVQDSIITVKTFEAFEEATGRKFKDKI